MTHGILNIFYFIATKQHVRECYHLILGKYRDYRNNLESPSRRSLNSNNYLVRFIPANQENELKT